MSGALESRLARFGLGRHAERIAASALPCVHLVLGRDGASDASPNRIGGSPLLDPATPWPRDARGDGMRFVLQADLARMPGPGDALVPGAGLVTVFLGRFDHHVVEHRVLVEAREPARRRDDPGGERGEDEFPAFASRALELVAATDYPRWSSFDEEALTSVMDASEGEAYLEAFLESTLPTGVTVGKFGGHVSGIGHDPRPGAVVRRGRSGARERDFWGAGADLREPRRWRHFLTIDSCRSLGLCIADAGYVQMLVHDDDLRAGDLSNLDVTIESS